MWQNREIKHISLLFKILWDTSSWPDNCTEISGASSSLKHVEIGPWLEGYWFKPLTPPAPTPRRGENEQVLLSLLHWQMLRCPWARQLTTMCSSEMTWWLVSEKRLCVWQLPDVTVHHYVAVKSAVSGKGCDFFFFSKEKVKDLTVFIRWKSACNRLKWPTVFPKIGIRTDPCVF